jgi:hypothetical protein
MKGGDDQAATLQGGPHRAGEGGGWSPQMGGVDSSSEGSDLVTVTDSDRGGVSVVKRPQSEDPSPSTREDDTNASASAGVAT